jgi:hypothetical protein
MAELVIALAATLGVLRMWEVFRMLIERAD